MKATLLTLSLLVTLTACAPRQPATSEAPPVPVVLEQESEITPAQQLQKPAVVLADVLKNYNETTTDCLEYGTGRPRGHYYCSGVIARAVDDGNFNPWMYSPTAIAIGASSYSWLRQDVTQSQLYHPAGFILRNRIDAISHSLPGLESGWICLYPYDAGTSTANGHKGCGYRGKNSDEAPPARPDDDNSQYAWGSCEPLGITTATQWNNDFNRVGNNRQRQCSWNIDSQHGWNNMITSRKSYPQLQNIWNELLLNNYGDGSQMPKYIAAYFYDVRKAGGLAAAQHFQAKMNNAGYNVPILRLDFTAANANRFSYVAADQVVPQ